MKYQTKNSDEILSVPVGCPCCNLMEDLSIALREIRDILERIEYQMRLQGFELAYEQAILNIKKKLSEGMTSQVTLAAESVDLFA